MKKFVECYDVGGTNIRGVIIDMEDHLERPVYDLRETIRGSPQKFLEQIEDMSQSMRKKFFSFGYSAEDIAAVSFGVPGPVKDGILLKAPPMHISSSIDIASELGRKIEEPIYVDNDMKTAVRAELNFGIGKEVENFYLLTISTGIGVGAVIDRKVVHGMSGEFGHIVLEKDLGKANMCSCGRYGCWVAQASGYGIELLAKKVFRKEMSAKDFFELYNSGDERVREIVKTLREFNAHGIGNMLNVFSVDAVVVMGSIGLKRFETVIPTKEEIRRYALTDVPDIVPTELGDDIGLLGAYMFAKEKLDLVKKK